tara:strand:- start:248 stop:442 length:195 start_codon:yes stop_codon:yes gene_type:complete
MLLIVVLAFAAAAVCAWTLCHGLRRAANTVLFAHTGLYVWGVTLFLAAICSLTNGMVNACTLPV